MIAVICLHPSIDRTLELSTPIVVGGLNRAARVWERAGGKGVNVASVLSGLGVEVSVTLPTAGSNGFKLRKLLQNQDILSFVLSVTGETRECQAILAGGQTTEINESGPSLSKDDLVLLEELIPERTPWVVLSGSLAPGLSVFDFGKWVRRLSTRHQVVVDTSGKALKAALENGAYLIKPNDSELEGLGLSALEVYKKYGTQVLHSRGENGLEYVGKEGHFKQAAFKVNLVNPVGAGDATLAGFLFGLVRGENLKASLRFASACGAAACLEPVAGVVNLEHLNQLLGVTHV